MVSLFISILNSGITASYVVIAVILVRFFFKKMPKRILPVLWLLVAIRLIFPFSIESALSLIPENEPISITENDVIFDDNEVFIPPQYPNSVPQEEIVITLPTEVVIETNHAPDILAVSSAIWITVCIGIFLYGIASFIFLKIKLKEATLFKDNVFQSECVSSPFILGFIKPRIFVPYNISQSALDNVILHENAHIKRKDHLIKPIAFILLSIYWFNPLLWVAYIFLCKDIELACDEKVIERIPESARQEYAKTLVECGIKKIRISACPIAFGEVGIKERVKNIINYKRPAFWVITVSVIICIVITVCFLTVTPSNNDDPQASASLWEDNAYTESPKSTAIATHTAIANTKAPGATLTPDTITTPTVTAIPTPTSAPTSSAIVPPTPTATISPTQKPTPSDLYHNFTIPEGATYTSVSNNKTYQAGEKFPNVKNGDIYIYGDYEYHFAENYNNSAGWVKDVSGNKWCVRVLDDTKTSYGPILESINSNDVTGLDRTFYGCKNLKASPIIPNNTTSMFRTFSGCTSLSEAPRIPDKVENMGNAFLGCVSLKYAPALPSSVTNLSGTFNYCTSLISVPDISNVTKVPYLTHTFEDCYSLKTVEKLPSNLEAISYAFKNCTSLTETPVLPNNIKEMTEAFEGCTSLKTITNLPNSLTSMIQSFYGCSALQSIPEFPSKLTNLASCFVNCTSLTSVPKLPITVTNLYFTFEGCTSLKTVTNIPDNVNDLRKTFRNCTSLTGTLTINAKPLYYEECFSGVNFKNQNLIITGNSKVLNEIIATGS